MIASNANAIRPYRLAPHSHACRIGDNVIVLDLKDDQYVGVPDGNVTDLADLVAGWPPQEEQRAITMAENQKEEVSDALEGLLSKNIIVENSFIYPEPALTSTSAPQRAVIDGYENVPYKIRLRDIVNICWAARLSKSLLRRRSLAQVAERFRKRLPHERNSPFDIQRVKRVVAVFNRLRPLIFDTRDECLFHSLAAAEFLRHYNIFPNWVFGVRMNPFGAHCWLQKDEWVINDTPENVCIYQSILVL